MEDKLEMMSELVGDGCNTVNPATYCDISNVGADKVSCCSSRELERAGDI